MSKTITNHMISEFEQYLRKDEKSRNTIEKYIRDVRTFEVYAANREVNKDLTMGYKNFLKGSYAVSSANSMITALNTFLRFLGWSEYCVRQYKVQRQTYCSEEKELTKEEYLRLVQTAKQKGKERLNLVLQTICGTGIRVSELECITYEAVQKGEAVVNSKGKTRKIFFVKKLQKMLLTYAKKQGIRHGAIFVTKNGNLISRSNIWREMKKLCQDAKVNPDKVFPHNLRHLFARIFYGIEKDIAKLADILGHSSINTTRIYIITTGAEHKRKMEQMHLII